MPAENGRPDNIATAVTEVSDRVSVLIREEIELAKAEMTIKATRIATGAAAVAAGAVFGVFAFVIALFTAAWGLNSAFGSLWEGFAVVLFFLLVLTAVVFLFAWRKLRVGGAAPTMAIDEARKIRDTVATRSKGK